MKNKVNLIGNVGAAPEVKTFESGKKKLSFSLATNERRVNKAGEWESNTTWHKLVAWGKTAERLIDKLEKGMQLVIEGKITQSSYEDKNGNRQYITEILVLDFVNGFKSKTA